MLSGEGNFQTSEESFNYLSFELQQADVKLKHWKNKRKTETKKQIILNYLNRKLQAIKIEGIKSEMKAVLSTQ